tara:strand:- start:2620 stop:3825 length:1206 start_codon:yes stop_codon:yes gene_type:complete
MRISTGTLYDASVKILQQQQADLFKTQQQISTGKRILTPADDPIGSAQVLNISQSASLNTQYATNRNSASSSLGLVENVLQGVTTLIQNVHTATVSAGNPILSDTDRKSIATELRGRLDELIGLANTTDKSEQFLFSGFQGNTKPFTRSASGVQYNGDQGQRLTQVSATRQLAASDSGSNIFERIKNGNGVFTTTANSTNVGTGIVDTGLVATPASLTGDNYQITFSVAGVTTYDILDTTTGTPVSAGNPYTNGNAINFDGIQFSISGAPKNGDQFTVAPSTNQSLFKTIDDLISVLETPASGQPGGTVLTNGLNTALKNLDHGLDHILSVRSSVGARLQEIDSLESVGSDLDIQFQQTLSQLQDVDLAEAISTLTRQQLFLEAAQKSFTTISRLSLFEFL